jgi:hypothetical protein
MPKGLFTQGVAILLDRPAKLEQIEAKLGDFEILGRQKANDSWAISGPSLIVSYRPESNGLVAVDAVDQPWPDQMGDPKKDPEIFAAWSMGHFGPYAFPGSLKRAAQQCWSWERGKQIPARHKAFIRVRSSYVFGTDDNAPVMPDDYAPSEELDFVTQIAAAFLLTPGALCYFNPNGEVLRNRQDLSQSLSDAHSNDHPPLDLWSNVRLFNINPEWVLMDTVGNAQLDLPDIEACFYAEAYDLMEIDAFLRNASIYLAQNGQVIRDSDTTDGPDGICWQAHQFKQGVCDPQREVLRFLPLDDRPLPPEFQSARKAK